MSQHNLYFITHKSSPPYCTARMLVSPNLDWAAEGGGGESAPQAFNPTVFARVRMAPNAACNGGNGCGHWGWCAAIGDPQGAMDDVNTCLCYPGGGNEETTVCTRCFVNSHSVYTKQSF